jgi:hypothetical protein
MENRREEKVKTQKFIPVKNKTPAAIQITAEQLLREAKERQLEYVAPVIGLINPSHSINSVC